MVNSAIWAAMKTQNSLPTQFQKMIAAFCDKCIKPQVSDEILNKISSYFMNLTISYTKPPIRRSQFDWLSLASESRIECEFTDKLKTIIWPTLESTIRWVDNRTPQTNQIIPKRNVRERRFAPRMPKQDRSPVSTSGKTSVRPHQSTVVRSDPVERFPELLLDWVEDPQSFQHALNY